MVKSFGVSDEDTGYYAGLVASSMFIGRALTCYFWGWLADKVGRRPVLLVSLALLLICMFIFGLSSSLYMAIFTRFLAGLSNGTVGTCKAVVSEACDNTNQAIGMSLLLSAWTMGLVIGPAIGGYLAEPAEKYPNVFPNGSFFDQFAFFLPCLFNCVATLITILLAYFFLQETLVKSETSSEPSELPMQSTVSSDSQVDSNDQRLLVGSDNSCTEITSSQEKEIIIIGDADNFKETENGQSSCSCSCCQRYRCCRYFQTSKLAVLLRNRNAVLTISVYCTISLAIIGFDELFSLWAATGPKHGGLGFSTDQIGTALLAVSAPLLFLQIWLYPKLERRLGSIRVFQFSSLVIGITILSMSGINTYYDRSTVLWPLLIGILLLMKLSIGWAFSSTGIFVNNTVGNELLGSVNGLAMTAASISRALAPVVSGSAFAWSISEGFKLGFPLDEHFAFAILTIVCFLCILLSCALPEGVNRRHVPAERV